MILLVKPIYIENLVTSLIEMIELPNFGHMITSTIQRQSCKKNFFGVSLTADMRT